MIAFDVFALTLCIWGAETLKTTSDAVVSVKNSIPFYIYEVNSSHLTDHPESSVWYKGFPDLALHEGLKNHPWRTLDPQNAELFYVPAYLSAAVKDHAPKWYFTRLAEILEASPYYHNRKKDHFISGHYFKVTHGSLGDASKYIENMWLLVQSTGGRGFPNQIPVPFGDVFDTIEMDVKSNAFKDRPFSLNLIGQADMRPAYSDRRLLIDIASHFPDARIACVGKCYEHLPDCTTVLNGCKTKKLGEEEYAQLLPQTKFGLMPGGDNPTSGRMYDFIAAGVIPIIISDPINGFARTSMPFASDLHWDNFTFSISTSKFRKDPITSIREIIASPPKVIDQKLNALWKIRTSLDWVNSAGMSRMPSLVLREIMRKNGKNVDPVKLQDIAEVHMPTMKNMVADGGKLFVKKEFDDGNFWEEDHYED